MPYRLVGCVCVAGGALGIFSHLSIPLEASTSYVAVALSPKVTQG